MAGAAKLGSMDVVAQRFFHVFIDHGVETAQIPRLLPQLKLDDLHSSEKLLLVLTPELLDQAAQFFGVRVQWLEGVDDEIYDRRYCYKEPELLLGHLAALQPLSDDRVQMPLRVLATTKQLDFTDARQQLLVPVLVEKIATVGDGEIYRYHVYRDGFDWSYEPARIQLKALVRLIFKAIGPVPLFVVSPSEIQEILAGKLVPNKFLDGCLITEPSLEDYALAAIESGQAKETEELPAVLRYIEEHGLQNFSFSVPPAFSAPVESSPNPVTPPLSPKILEVTHKIGKRAQSARELWGPVESAAMTFWAEDDLLSIAEVIRRIKRIPTFKASVYTESAIRKHIAKSAPINIRGKAGRKPNKSP